MNNHVSMEDTTLSNAAIVAFPDVSPRPEARERFDGLDIFVEWSGSAESLVAQLEPLGDPKGFQLFMISHPETNSFRHRRSGGNRTGYWLCRFRYGGAPGGAEHLVVPLLARLSDVVRWMHVDKYVAFDGATSFTATLKEV